MKKIVALVAALAVAGSLFAADEQKTVILTNTVQGSHAFGFSTSETLASFLDNGVTVSSDLDKTALYAGYKTNATETVSLSLKATKFHNDKGGDDIGFTLASSEKSDAAVEAGATDPVVILTDAAGTKALRTRITKLTYSTAPVWTDAVTGDYKATLTLTYSAQ